MWCTSMDVSTPTFNGHWAHGGQSPRGTCQEVPPFSGFEYKSPGADIQNQTHFASLVSSGEIGMISATPSVLQLGDWLRLIRMVLLSFNSFTYVARMFLEN